MSENLRKLTIAIDCDDVIVPTSSVLLNAYNRRHGTRIGLESFYSDSLWGADTPEEGTWRVDQLLQEGVTAKVLPTPEAVEYIHRLSKDGHELHVVTGRQNYQEAETHRLLAEHFPGVFASVEHTNMYASGHAVALKRSKGAVCRSLGADMLVDDHIYHSREVLRYGVKNAVVFGDYPWNISESLEAGMARCASWASTYLEVVRIAKGS